MGSVSSGSYETPQSFGPWGRNAAPGNVVGTLAIERAVNVKESRAPKLCFCFRASAPDAGELRFVFPSDCLARPCRDNSFDVRDEVSEADREEVCAQLVAEWNCIEAGWVAGGKANVARRASGRRARIPLGGVGGDRLLRMNPEPVIRPTWQAVVGNHRNAQGLLFEYAGAHGATVARLAKRAKPPSAGGEMVVFSPPTEKELSLTAPASFLEAQSVFCTESPSEESSGRSVRTDTAAWRLESC